MIKSIRKVVGVLFRIDCVTQFSDEVLGYFSFEKLPVRGNITNGPGKLYHMLKTS